MPGATLFTRKKSRSWHQEQSEARRASGDRFLTAETCFDLVFNPVHKISTVVFVGEEEVARKAQACHQRLTIHLVRAPRLALLLMPGATLFTINSGLKMNTSVGTVGIVMPMYNARQTVLRAVQSVINQIEMPVGIVLIDNRLHRA